MKKEVVARVLDSSWDEFSTHGEAITFAKRFQKFHPEVWVAIYDQLGLFAIV